MIIIAMVMVIIIPIIIVAMIIIEISRKYNNPSTNRIQEAGWNLPAKHL